MESLTAASILNRNSYRFVGFRIIFQDGSYQDIFCNDMSEAVRRSNFRLENPIEEVLELGVPF